MIAKIRSRFIVLTMASLILVLAVIVGFINYTSYLNITEKADGLLSYLADHGGYFPNKQDDKGEKPPNHGFRLSSEAPFETRYFSVLVNDQGEVIKINIGQIYAVGPQNAADYALRAWEKGTSKGYLDQFRYLKHPTAEGTLILFLDHSRELNSYHTFLKASILTSVLGILAVFGLVLLLSKRAIRPIAESYDKQKRFITDAGHELKTPLSIIGANAEVIEMEWGESEWTKSIQNQVHRLTELTNSLVTLSRMDEIGHTLPLCSFSLSDAVTESAEPFYALAKTHGKGLYTHVEEKISYTGEEQSLRQLVGILLDNAIKYSVEGSDIFLSLESQGKDVVLRCENQVEGMEAGDHSELFDRFYRGDESRNSESGGYGIGLSLAKATVEAHKGRLVAKCKNGNPLIITAYL